MPKKAKYWSKMSLITRRITGGFFVVHWDFFPIIMPSSTFIFSSSIVFQRVFREIQDYPGIIQEYFWITKKKLVRLPQENSKETEKCPEKTRSFQGILMKFHGKFWKFPGTIRKFSVKNPKVFTENLKFPWKTQEFPGKNRNSWLKPEIGRKTGTGQGKNPEVFTENLKFPEKTQEFSGKPQVSWGKTGIPG
jgi:hypothetical protein